MMTALIVCALLWLALLGWLYTPVAQRVRDENAREHVAEPRVKTLDPLYAGIARVVLYGLGGAMLLCALSL